MTVTSVERGFQILRALPETDGTLSSVAQETGLPMSTVSRLLATLEQVGAVLRSDKTYRIGPALIELAGGQPAYDLVGLTTTHLAELASSTNETAGVVEAVGDETVHLAQFASEHDVTVKDWTGSSVGLHHGAIGFVIMAHWDKSQIKSYLSNSLEQYSPFTVTDPPTILERLDQVRATGWLWTESEYALDVTTVAAPIRDRSGRAVAALHVHGPSYRFPGDGDRALIGADVLDRAEAVSAILGWRPEQGSEGSR